MRKFIISLVLINVFSHGIRASEQWDILKESDANNENLGLLFANKIPVIRVKNFLSEAECKALSQAVKAEGYSYYENVNHPIKKIGITQFEHSKKPKEEYFSKVEEASLKRDRIFSSSSTNILQKIKSLFAEDLEERVEIAAEPNLGTYFSGLFRQIDEAKLHFDFASYDAPGWFVGSVQEQISLNIYLQEPDHGGGCVVYNKAWRSQIYEKYLLDGHSGSYAFQESLVENVPHFLIKPHLGDLCLFNTRNFHKVLKSEGDRITFSSFIGKTQNKEHVLWS